MSRRSYGSYADYGGGERDERRLSVGDYIVMGVTSVFVLLLAASCLAPLVSPSAAWPLAMLGLVFPILYLLCLLLFLYWVIRWRRFALVPLAALLVGTLYLPRTVQPEFSRNARQETGRGDLKLLSYNVRGFIGVDDEGVAFSSVERILGFVDSCAPDIICFQEFQTTPLFGRKKIDSMLGAWPYRRINYKIGQGDAGWGTAIYSRYPIVDSDEVDLHSTNSAQWADIVVDRKDTLRLFNAHLQSFLLTSTDKDFINEELMMGGGDTESKVKSIVGKLKRGYISRTAQADTLAGIMAGSPYERVVCGDFNDTPVSYVYNTMRRGLSDAFVEKGRGMKSNTYRGFFDLFRIDYILHSDGYRVKRYAVSDRDFSDHNPVEVSLGRR